MPVRMLENFNSEHFLKHHWQKKPLLIKQALSLTSTPITAEELAGLSLEEEVESRLMKGTAMDLQLAYGPFDEEIFKTLPEKEWTLLVQHVDKWHPPVTELLQAFQFIPNWRIDDIMVSYSTPNGSVGAHIDSYDVFLLQTQGTKKWLLNENDYSENDFSPDLEHRVIDNFVAEREWLLEPGDMLYLPPGVAHHGIAVDDCITCSIGFRAPSDIELLSMYAEDKINENGCVERFNDPDRELQSYPGEIQQSELQRLHQLLKNTVSDPAVFNDWFAKLMTRAEYDLYTDDSLNIDQLLQHNIPLICHPACRVVFIQHDEQLFLYANAEKFMLHKSLLPLVDRISRRQAITIADINSTDTGNESRQLLQSLLDRGILVPYE